MAPAGRLRPPQTRGFPTFQPAGVQDQGADRPVERRPVRALALPRHAACGAAAAPRGRRPLGRRAVCPGLKTAPPLPAWTVRRLRLLPRSGRRACRGSPLSNTREGRVRARSRPTFSTSSLSLAWPGTAQGGHSLSALFAEATGGDTLSNAPQLEERALHPACGPRPICLPGPSEGAGRACTIWSAA